MQVGRGRGGGKQEEVEQEQDWEGRGRAGGTVAREWDGNVIREAESRVEVVEVMVSSLRSSVLVVLDL